MTNTKLIEKYFTKKQSKKNSFFEIAKNHIIKSNDNKTLSLEVDKIVYDL